MNHSDILKKLSATVGLIVLLFAATGSAHAQNNVISGTIYEMVGNDKSPIIGANIVLVNKQNRYIKGTVSDIDGNYNIEVPAGEGALQVRISYIGMKTQTYKYTGQTRLDVTLQSDDSHNLGEVTVVGRRTDAMGVSRLEQTAAVQRLDMSKIVEESPAGSIGEALQAVLTPSLPIPSRLSSSTGCPTTPVSPRTSTSPLPTRRTSEHCSISRLQTYRA